ncbi:peptidylprolyl isomerase [Paenibacillus spongiae]|uniref:Peptidylprolyl isomerase n=1 Tax=Paenibacillus spongiae TaxID=2909671 RepID=A0ABY5S8W9_9BACL|nr:peptidylprolyl isomerase [Paenibacillus spongiae]UVI30361.1 peptidylprolyl isomerase [Paenibacillus spongiae]
MLRTKPLKKGILLALTAVLVIVLAAGCGKKEEAPNTGGKPATGQTKAPGEGEGKVIATYKDGTVTDGEFNKYTSFFGIVNPQTAMYLSIPQLKEQFLREYVGYKILSTRLTLTDDEKKKAQEETDAFYTQVKTAMDQNPDLKKTVEDAKLSEADIKYFYNMIMSIMKSEESKVKDDAVKKYYEDNKNDYNLITARHILVATADSATGEELRTEEEALKRAKEVKAKLDKGGDWNALAKQYSDDPGSKDKGGLYENQEAKGWVPEFKDAANKQEINKIGEPVKTDYGYHVIKVEKRESTPFDKLTDEKKLAIKQTIAAENLNTFMTKELPDLITKIDLPKEEAPAGDGATNGGAANGGEAEGGAANDGKTNAPADDKKEEAK